MTKTKKMLQLALVLAMVGGPLAIAQEVATPQVVIPQVTIPQVVIPQVTIPQVTVPQQIAVNAHVTVPVINLQTNVAVKVAYQAKDDLFAGAEKFAQGASEVTEINLDPTTMGLVGMNHGKDGEEARKMKSMSIHTYKYDKPGMYRMEDVDAYRKKLEDGSWHCAIHVRTTTGSTDICSRTGADKETNEMVILTAEPQKLTFIHMSGKMSLDELNHMSGSAGALKPHTGLPNPPKPPKVKTTPPVPPAGPASPAPAASPAPSGSPI
jgi:hypothetical protein